MHQALEELYECIDTMPYDECNEHWKSRLQAIFEDGLAAARPLIEAEVREQVAREIEALVAPDGGSLYGQAYNRAAEVATRIARGAS